MKNKKLTYVLLPLVILIWGVVIFRIFNYAGDADDYVLYDKYKTLSNSSSVVPDTFRIVANYPDPFLKGGVRIVRAQDEGSYHDSKPEQNKKSQTTNGNLVPSDRWPVISYSGIVVNGTGSRKTVLVSVDGRECILQISENCGDLKLLKILPDSILVSFNNENRFIRRFGL